MNERLLVLAANEITAEQEATLSGARGRVLRCKKSLKHLIDTIGDDTEPAGKWGERVADCDAWLAAADRLEERNKMIERFREKIRNAPVFVLSDEERARLDRIEAEAKEQGYVSNGEMLLSILERARAEHDRVKALVEKWRRAAEIDGDDDRARAVGWCADELEKALTEPTDEPISDPAERAKAVAKELRRRGLWCEADVINERVWVPRPPSQGEIGNVGAWHDVDGDCVTMGPLAIADRIQAEEVKRAKAWAGDK